MDISNVRLNASGRLFRLLKMMQALPRETPLHEAWRIAFGDNAFCYSRLAETAELANHAKFEIGTYLQDESSIFLEHFDKIELLLSCKNLDSLIASYRSCLSEEVLQQLGFASIAVSKLYVENEVPKEELEGLLIRVQQAMSGIANGGFDTKFKDLAIDLLSVVQNGLQKYNFRGSAGLEDALHAAMGKLYHLNKVSKTESEKKECQSAASIVETLNTLVSLAVNTPQLVALVGKYTGLV